MSWLDVRFMGKSGSGAERRKYVELDEDYYDVIIGCPCPAVELYSHAYVVYSGSKRRYAKTKEKALQIASEMLDCDGKVEIKRIELN